MEPVQPQVKLKERQKFFEEAFQQDMEHYLSTGYLQIAERRGELHVYRRLPKPEPDKLSASLIFLLLQTHGA